MPKKNQRFLSSQGKRASIEQGFIHALMPRACSCQARLQARHAEDENGLCLLLQHWLSVGFRFLWYSSLRLPTRINILSDQLQSTALQGRGMLLLIECTNGGGLPGSASLFQNVISGQCSHLPRPQLCLPVTSGRGLCDVADVLLVPAASPGTKPSFHSLVRIRGCRDLQGLPRCAVVTTWILVSVSKTSQTVPRLVVVGRLLGKCKTILHGCALRDVLSCRLLTQPCAYGSCLFHHMISTSGCM